MSFIAISLILIYLNSLSVLQAFTQNFKEEQMRYPRVRAAICEKDSLIRDLFEQRGVQYPPQGISIRVFKDERVLELWAHSHNNEQFTFIKQYEICMLSGELGPKREQGDMQTPEGFYYVDRFNPFSNFHLSLKINYPNQSDRILGNQGNLGSDIFIHGSCVAIGCIPITDDKIKELYLIAVEAKSNGQERIPVHIFPAKLDEPGFRELQENFRNNNSLISFWENLEDGFGIFERIHYLPGVFVNGDGNYSFRNFHAIENQLVLSELTSNMNFRNEPNIHSEINCVLNRGSRFFILDEESHNENVWLYIRTLNGLEGWVCGIYRGRFMYNIVNNND